MRTNYMHLNGDKSEVAEPLLMCGWGKKESKGTASQRRWEQGVGKAETRKEKAGSWKQASDSQLSLGPAPPGTCQWLKQCLTSLQFPNYFKKAAINVENRLDSLIREIKESYTKQQPFRIP